MIVVAGEALVDLLVAPDGSVAARPGGGPVNAARTIGRLGGSVAFLGRLSADRFGEGIRTLLAEDGVSLALAEPAERPTTLAVAELDGHGRATYRFHVAGTSAPALVPADLAAAWPLLADPGRRSILHLGTLGLVLEPMASTLIGLVGELPATTLLAVDPNCRPALIDDLDRYRARLGAVLRRADLVKVSDEDLATLAPGRPARAAAEALLELGPRLVLLTSGGEPALAITAAGSVEATVPAVVVEDTVGAGDAFSGAFVAWWEAAGLGRDSLADPVAVADGLGAAVAVAAMTCERVGASPPTLGELAERGVPWPARRG